MLGFKANHDNIKTVNTMSGLVYSIAYIIQLMACWYQVTSYGVAYTVDLTKLTS